MSFLLTTQTRSLKWILVAFILGGTLTAAFADTHYVNVDNPAPSSPFANWATAANTIQDAVDEATAGDSVLVTNGVYDAGSRATPDHECSNRLVITNEIIVRSVNGPDATAIKGAEASGGGTGSDAVRGVYMSAGVLSGFTVTNGHTMNSGHGHYDESGGGVNMYGGNGVVSNCIIAGNSAEYDGGGCAMGTLCICTIVGNFAEHHGGGSCMSILSHCTLAGNSADGNGGGSYYGTLNKCTLSNNWSDAVGGGSYWGTLNNCRLSDNAASLGGGGSCYGTLNNCLLTGNSVEWNDGGGSRGGTLNNCILWSNTAAYGGGAAWSTLSNCIVTGNSATEYGGGDADCTMNNCTVAGNSADGNGGGSYYGTLRNCIVYFNTAGSEGDNWYDYDTLDISYSCTIPAPIGTGNITNDPQFVDHLSGDYHLSASSACIDAGAYPYEGDSSTDMDNNPRVVNAIVDIGAYEYQQIVDPDTDGDGMPNIWEHAGGGNPADAADASKDKDGDGIDNLDEYYCGTAMNDPKSCLMFEDIGFRYMEEEVVIRWQSAEDRHYSIYRSTNLLEEPIPLKSSIEATPPMNTATDKTAVGTGPWFYRIKLEE